LSASSNPKSSNTLRNLAVAFLVFCVVAGAIGYQYYERIFLPNVPKELKQNLVQIPTGSSFEDVVTILKKNEIIKDEEGFRWVADQMKYVKPKMRSGQFEIQPGWSNRQLISHLRNGKQTPVKLVLTNERLPEEVAEKAARFIEADSKSIAQLLTDPDFLAQHQYTPETAISMIIPNTYELFWNTDANGFFDRMKKEHQRFWDKDDRKAKAKALELSPEEVYTLASIVERETNKNQEKARIAGVYLNRLEKGMLLQADPTVVFATRDFTTRRVLNRHLEFDSPYNTYKYTGLPPGPISMASIASLDAVLNAEDHNFIFFCARPDNSGLHAFAKNLAGHNQNARKYRRWLSKRGY